MAVKGENEVWVKQTGGVVVENCLQETQEVLYLLGKWFKEKTGKMLVCTAGTNGSHASGTHSHAAGWKLDVNDWSGPEGLDCTLFGYFNSPDQATQLFKDFIDYGHSIGVGMAVEGDHLDIQISGYEWTTGQDYGGYGKPNGNTNNNITVGSNGFMQQQLNAHSAGFQVSGNVVKINPNKTYSEPVYPDYIYVSGNIPSSAVTDKAAQNAMLTNNTTESFNLVTGENFQKLTGLNFAGFTTDEAMKITQREYNPKKAVSEVKVPSAGKPINNNDPFPVDLKIEELELHLPRVKKYSCPFVKDHGETQDIAKLLLSISDSAEKRIVRLENMLATVMRYTFAMGSRMHINCLYYGGQSR